MPDRWAETEKSLPEGDSGSVKRLSVQFFPFRGVTPTVTEYLDGLDHAPSADEIKAADYCAWCILRPEIRPC